ncbi:hypothetical protein BCR32DRAFT_270573 [Anaeromyces robustus]|uniref:G-protein coupled receptors family 3 profile domain-containing protein n=1 Tax=Anaeromyces robustus TaxID=1754192 RepID=A0A1Y1WVI4_9FUNG|nr:hypothetical protein BCR32DRAFT_270573 [Anaeromyces robustus]|eukprot:ORX77550.1 hypothetical protein BCR32DRAFT_270573 [Anaeromyces robustus]
MYGIVIFMILFHIMICTLWTILHKIESEPDLTGKKKIYQRCKYPKTRTYSIIFNFAVLFLGCYFSYQIRYVKRNFQENLVLTVYVYVVTMIITEIINLQDKISITVKDSLSAAATILNTSVILIYLYFIKFYAIYNNTADTNIPIDLLSLPGKGEPFGSKTNLINRSNDSNINRFLSNNNINRSNDSNINRFLSNNNINRSIDSNISRFLSNNNIID